MNCIIKEGIIEAPTVHFADTVIAHITGRGTPRCPRTAQYENVESGEKYQCLAGGFAWPGLRPGFACVVAALAGADPYKPVFKVLAEVQENGIEALLERSHALYERWGANCNVIRWFWYGESDEARSTFLHRFNGKLKRADSNEQFILASPPHVEQPNRFEFYTRTLYTLLLERRLLFPDRSALPGYLKKTSRRLKA